MAGGFRMALARATTWRATRAETGLPSTATTMRIIGSSID
jgi:hypothetical protein